MSESQTQVCVFILYIRMKTCNFITDQTENREVEENINRTLDFDYRFVPNLDLDQFTETTSTTVTTSTTPTAPTAPATSGT